MLDSAVFRNVIARFASGVGVVTTSHDGRDWGMTASAICSVSLDPPTVLICANRMAPSGNAFSAARHFAINILGSEQRWIAEKFARPMPNKFNDVEFRRGGAGDPLLVNCLATLECQVVEEVTVGSHRVLIADVLAADAFDVQPLAYYRGTFGRFELAEDSDAYRLLFDKIIDRSFPLDESLDPHKLGKHLGVAESAIGYALTRLIGDGLVVRDPELGYRQVGFDPNYAIECYEAKRMLDQGTADCTVGRVSLPALSRLRVLCDRANAHVSSAGILDVPGYRSATTALQEEIISFAGNRALAVALRILRIPELISIPQQATRERALEIATNRNRIVTGYEEEDLTMTKQALNDQADLHIEICLDLLTGRNTSV